MLIRAGLHRQLCKIFFSWMLPHCVTVMTYYWASRGKTAIPYRLLHVLEAHWKWNAHICSIGVRNVAVLIHLITFGVGEIAILLIDNTKVSDSSLPFYKETSWPWKAVKVWVAKMISAYIGKACHVSSFMPLLKFWKLCLSEELRLLC